MKLSLLVAILTAASTTAYFSGRIYLLLAETKAQHVAAEQRARDFWTNRGQPPALVPWPKRTW